MKNDPICMRLLLEASNYAMVPFMQPVLQTPRTQIRAESKHLVALGFWLTCTITKNFDEIK